MKEVEQSEFLARQQRDKSFLPLQNQQESKIDQMQEKKMDQTKINIYGGWKNILYFVGLGILFIILILYIGVQIDMEYTRRTNFVDNVNRMNTRGVMEQPSIPIVKQDQNESQRGTNNIPDFTKISDVIVKQHVKQTLTSNNLQKNKQVNVPTVRYTTQNIQSSSHIEANRNLPQQSSLVVPQNTYTSIVTPKPNFSQDNLLVPKQVAPQFPQEYRRQVVFHPQKDMIDIDDPLISDEQMLNATRWKDLVGQDYTLDTVLARSERQYYQKKYNILQYSELPFCLVVPTFNNVQNNRYLHNIRSIVMQEYQNFHVVVIDDGSSDKTGQLIDNFMRKQTKIPLEKYLLISNTIQQNAMPNLRMAAMEYCQPDEIFLIIDGDDQLIGRQVLRFFNAVFQKNQVWFVYSNFLASHGGIGFSRYFPQNIIQQNRYRKYYFVTSHLRAFYTQLFRNIKEEDLKDQNGQYFHAANDVSICIPILEMAHKKVMYVPELTYYYNSNTGLNNHIVRSQEQTDNDIKIRNKISYAELTELKFDQ